jgi:hypothetical protein
MFKQHQDLGLVARCWHHQPDPLDVLLLDSPGTASGTYSISSSQNIDSGASVRAECFVASFSPWIYDLHHQ